MTVFVNPHQRNNIHRLMALTEAEDKPFSVMTLTGNKHQRDILIAQSCGQYTSVLTSVEEFSESLFWLLAKPTSKPVQLIVYGEEGKLNRIHEVYKGKIVTERTEDALHFILLPTQPSKRFSWLSWMYMYMMDVYENHHNWIVGLSTVEGLLSLVAVTVVFKHFSPQFSGAEFIVLQYWYHVWVLPTLSMFREKIQRTREVGVEDWD